MSNLQKQFIVNSTGHRTAVILPLKEYEQLLEDLHDLAVVIERREEEPVTLEEIKRWLKISGVK
jgi:PHD/YefM family antitoxin component YafN of YafNO toxin-antitoxin module